MTCCSVIEEKQLNLGALLLSVVKCGLLLSLSLIFCSLVWNKVANSFMPGHGHSLLVVTFSHIA